MSRIARKEKPPSESSTQRMEVQARHRECQGIPAIRPQSQCRSPTPWSRHMARGDERLDEKAIDRLVLPGRVELERRQVHVRVPFGEERVIPLEALRKLAR